MKKDFRSALKGKELPVLTLDPKWYKLMTELGKDGVQEYEEELNALLKLQGKINKDTRELRAVKKRLMSEIITMADEAQRKNSDRLNKKLERHKQLVEECNEKLEGLAEEGKGLPLSIEDVNRELMAATMEYCHDVMQQNEKEIAEIAHWVSTIRIQLKKKLVEKQMMEQRNQEIYAFMHNVIGPEAADLFDQTIEDK